MASDNHGNMDAGSFIFEIDGVQLQSDNGWKGSCDNKGQYLVNASLQDEDGNTYEKLTLVQGLLQ